MTKNHSFEDLLGWQRARELAKAVFAASKRREGAPSGWVAEALQQSAVAVMSRLAEAQERPRGGGEFLEGLAIAKAQCAELRTLLYVALDQGGLSSADFEKLQEQSLDVMRLIGGLMKYLREPRSLGDSRGQRDREFGDRREASGEEAAEADRSDARSAGGNRGRPTSSGWRRNG